MVFVGCGQSGGMPQGGSGRGTKGWELPQGPELFSNNDFLPLLDGHPRLPANNSCLQLASG